MDPLRKIKTHTFYGHKYRFIYGKLESHISRAKLKKIATSFDIKNHADILALTDDHDVKEKAIIVRDNIEQPKELLRVLLDEALHALDYKIDDNVIDHYSRDLSNFLWRCGYRRVTQDDDSGNNQKV